MEQAINNDDDENDSDDKSTSLVTDCGIHPLPTLVEINSQPGKYCHHDTGVVSNQLFHHDHKLIMKSKGLYYRLPSSLTHPPVVQHSLIALPDHNDDHDDDDDETETTTTTTTATTATITTTTTVTDKITQ